MRWWQTPCPPWKWRRDLTKKCRGRTPPFCVSINPCRACSLSSSQGELEGAKPASNRIKCRAKPCYARRAWSEANIFVPLCGTKITALLQAVEKSRRLFRQPEGDNRKVISLFVEKHHIPILPVGSKGSWGRNCPSSSRGGTKPIPFTRLISWKKATLVWFR